MKALTIRNPWAELIARGEKLVENRSGGTAHRGPLAIHVSRTVDTPALVRRDVHVALGSPLYGAPLLDEQRGHVIAVAELVDVHEADGVCCGPWAEHRYDGPRNVRWMRHLVLSDVRRLARPVPAAGALGVWNVDDDLIDRAGWET